MKVFAGKMFGRFQHHFKNAPKILRRMKTITSFLGEIAYKVTFLFTDGA